MRIHPIAIFLFAGILFAQSELQSPDVDMGALTLDRCIELALRENYGISMQREAVRRSELGYLSSLSSLMPSASTHFSWSRSDEEGFSYSESGLIFSRDHYSAGFSANQTLFSGGRNYLDAKSARVARDISRSDFIDRKAELIYNVKMAFYSALSAEKTRENARRAVERIDDQMKLVRERDELGLADPTEVTQIKVSLAQTQLSNIQAKNAEQKAKESLSMLLSLPLDSDMELVDSKSPQPRSKSLDDYIKEALANSPKLRSAELALQRARLSKMSAWAPYMPGLSASYSYSWSDSKVPSSIAEFDSEASWSVGVSANWSIFSGTSRIAGLKISESALNDAKTNLAMTKQSIEVSVRDAYRKMEEAVARIELVEARVENAKLNSELFKEKYRLGDCTLAEMLDAELSLREAEAEAVAARLDFNTAIAELARWSGNPE